MREIRRVVSDQAFGSGPPPLLPELAKKGAKPDRTPLATAQAAKFLENETVSFTLHVLAALANPCYCELTTPPGAHVA